MKEYAMFVKTNGDVDLYCGGQFVIGANGLGTGRNIATLWNALDSFGERIIELKEIGIDSRSGDLTFAVKTLPKDRPIWRY